MTSAVPVSSWMRTSFTLAGDSALATKSAGSSENGTMSIFSPRSSLTTMRTAGAAGADAGADRVDVVVVRPDRDLRAVAGLAGAGLDLDDAVGDLGHLELEQPLDEARDGCG